MKCNYCGNDLPQNVKHCPYCRAQVLDFEENTTNNTEYINKPQKK